MSCSKRADVYCQKFKMLCYLIIFLILCSQCIFHSDILDICWSPDDSLLASSGVDNSVHIWNAKKFPGNGN